MPPIHHPYEGEHHAIAGVELTTPRYALRTITGLDEHPELRGGDITVPSIPGARPLPREHGSRLVAYGLAVTNLAEDGTLAALEADQDAQYQANLEELQAALADPHRQVELTRTRTADARILTATGWAHGLQEFAPILDRVERSAIARLQLSDPYWYGEEIEVGGPIAASPTDVALAHPGTAYTHKLRLDFTGPITNPRVEDVETGFYVEALVDVPAGLHLIIDTEAFTVQLDGVQAVGSMRHSGGFAWQRIRPGANTLRVTALTPGGSLAVAFRPPYI